VNLTKKGVNLKFSLFYFEKLISAQKFFFGGNFGKILFKLKKIQKRPEIAYSTFIQ
jgi:hypothetical protein